MTEDEKKLLGEPITSPDHKERARTAEPAQDGTISILDPAMERLLNDTSLLIQIRRRLLDLDLRTDVAKRSRVTNVDDASQRVKENMQQLRDGLRRYTEWWSPHGDFHRMNVERVKGVAGDEEVWKHWVKEVVAGTKFEERRD